MFFYSMFVFFGFFLLIKGADYLVAGASLLAKKFHIPTIIIGLTIVAIGTSMPELMVSLTANLNGSSDISIGNILGSNIANLFFILGICSIIKPLKFQKETEYIQNWITVLAVTILFFFGNNSANYIISRKEGLILLILALLFILYNIKSTKNNYLEFENNNIKQISIVKSLFLIILGIFALKNGGDVVVKYTSKIALLLGISEKIISVTIIAFATSLPELLTSITACKKGDTDMAIGNIIGSQIFNIFLIIGTSAIFTPITYSPNFNYDLLFLLFGTIIFATFPFTGKKHYMTKLNGVFFTMSYAIYLAYNVLKVL